MRIVLMVISMLGLLLVVACEKNSEASPIIAEAEIYYDQNDELEKLYVRMVTGEFKEETEPGPFMGSYWEGEFRLELTASDGTLLFTKDLNPSFGNGPLLFSQNRDFQIEFKDYNDDGYLDFTIGQYVSSNGFTYNLYSLMPDGIALLHQNILTADSKYSTLYEKEDSPTSFKNRYYDMEKGEYLETYYTWQGEQFVRTECEGCGMTTGEAEDETAGELKLVVEKTDDGFRLASEEGDSIHVSQTLVSPAI